MLLVWKFLNIQSQILLWLTIIFFAERLLLTIWLLTQGWWDCAWFLIYRGIYGRVAPVHIMCAGCWPARAMAAHVDIMERWQANCMTHSMKILAHAREVLAFCLQRHPGSARGGIWDPQHFCEYGISIVLLLGTPCKIRTLGPPLLRKKVTNFCLIWILSLALYVFFLFKHF